MAINTVECDEMIRAALLSDKILQIGHVRRFYDNVRWIKSAIEMNVFGDLTHFDVEEGFEFNWPIQSDALLKLNKAGGGVLVDTGSHVIDTLMYWFESIDVIEYLDDAFIGGVEAESFIKVTTLNNIKGSIKLSRLRTLRNTFKLYFQNSVIELGLNANSDIGISINDKTIRSKVDNINQSTKEAFKSQLVSFYESIVLGKSVLVSGNDGRATVEFMEKCYQVKQQLSTTYYLNESEPN